MRGPTLLYSVTASRASVPAGFRRCNPENFVLILLTTLKPDLIYNRIPLYSNLLFILTSLRQDKRRIILIYIAKQITC
jgi:hypothetical protein